MKNIFFDTNILLDVFLERHPFCEPAQRVWSLVDSGLVRGGISAISVSNIFFIIKKLSNTDKAYRAIESLQSMFKVVELGSRIIKKSLSVRFADFEDALQYFSALAFKAHYLLTRDAADFKEKGIPILDCSQFLSLGEK